MKFSSKLIVLLIFFLTISAASAAEELNDDTILSQSTDYSAVDNTATLSESVTHVVEDNSTLSSEIIDEGSEEIIGASVSNETVLGDYDHSFKKLQEEIDSFTDNTYVLDRDYVYDSDYDTPYGGIIINKTGFTIDGNGHAVRGNPTHSNTAGARIFIVTADYVTF